MRTSHNLVGLALLAALGAAAWGADDLATAVERNGRSFAVRASATLAASQALVWQVLTDYENLPRFIPGLASSTVQLRAGNRVLVEQRGEARFLIFAYPIEVRLDVIESTPHSIASRSVAGNLRRMSGRYELQRAPEGLLLRYTGEFEPDFELPPVIGTLAVRTMVEEQFAAMVGEIERRAALEK